MQAVQKDLMDMLVRELKEELEAHDQPKTGNKAWLRRETGCTARSCARILQSETESHKTNVHMEWALLPFCDLGQTFTVLIRV